MVKIFGEKDDEKFNISPAEEITYNGAVYTLVQREAQPEEVAEAKWARINRKPNEFKKGDIVRLFNGTGFQTYDDKNYGGEIVGFHIDGDVNIRHFSDKRKEVSTENIKNVKLVVPVEQRFDLEGGGDVE